MTKEQRNKIKQSLKGQFVTIHKGRSSHSAGFSNSTPVDIVEGNEKPRFVGLPFLKTNFKSGNGFSKVLYTPSTLRVVVGSDWLGN